MDHLRITKRDGNAVSYELVNDDGLVVGTSHLEDASELITQARAEHRSLASVIARSISDRPVEELVLSSNPSGAVDFTHTHEEFTWGVPDHDHPVAPHQHQHTHEDFPLIRTDIKEQGARLGGELSELRTNLAGHEHPLAHHQHPLLDAGISALEGEISKLARHTHGEYAGATHEHIETRELAASIANLNAALASLRNQLEAHTHEEKVYAEVAHTHDVQPHRHEGQGCPHENLYFLAEENTNGRPRRIYGCDKCDFKRSMWEATVVGR